MNHLFKTLNIHISKQIGYVNGKLIFSPLIVNLVSRKSFYSPIMASIMNDNKTLNNQNLNSKNEGFGKVACNLIKSENDCMEYRLIQLDNGLRAILVSDVKNIIDLDSVRQCEAMETEPLSAANDEDEEDEDDEEEEEEEFDQESSEESEGRNSKSSLKRNEEKMAACALCIGVGSFSDPPDIPGLAHFLEHMVFMGSKKHPQENGFDEFIKKHGGSDNGVTECETTTFYLECNERYLREGMDRFAQFFISPLMKREAMTREREAIHSEFEMALPSDGSRREQILGMLAPNGHPAAKFLWGNLTTLRDNINDEFLYDKVHEFRERHYSAHRMTLAVQARLSLDLLETYVRESFSDVPSNNLPPDNFDQYAGAYGNENFHKLLWIKPVKDICQVHLTWILPSYLKEYKSRPLDYMGWLIGHEGEGSLISYLRKKVWALECIAGNDESGFELNSIYSLFTLYLTLTEEGFDNLNEVLCCVFSYVSMLRERCPNEAVYDELETISRTNFRYKMESPSSDYVESLAESMHFYEPEHYIAGGEVFLEYKPEVLQEVLDGLTPDRVNVIIYSPVKKDEFYDRVEPWFQTPFKVEDIPSEWKKNWSQCKSSPHFHIPHPNPYLTNDFSLLESPERNPAHPVKILDDDLVELWYKQDAKFKRPISYYSFYIINPLARTNPLNAAMLDVLTSYLEVKFVEKVYPANQAGLNCNYYSSDLGLAIHFSGYNEKLPLLFEEILRLVKKYIGEINKEDNVELFSAILKEKSRSYYNTFLKPSRMVKMARMSVLVEDFWTCVERRAVIDQITSENLHEFAARFFNNVWILGLIQGNVSKERALRISGKFPEILRCSPLTVPRPLIKVARLNEGKINLRIKSFNENDSNSVITNYYQAGPGSVRTTCIIDIIMMLMDEPLFDNLRTKQQIGYDVQCLLRDTFGILGFSVTAHFQATKFTPDEVDDRIEAFLNDFLNTLKSMSKSELEETKAALCSLKSSADLQLYDEVKRNFAEITSSEYIFDRLQKEVAVIPDITQEEVCQWFQNHISLGKEFKKLSVQIIGSSKQSDNEKPDDTLREKRVFKISTISNGNDSKSFISDIEKFKQTRVFYPEGRRS